MMRQMMPRERAGSFLEEEALKQRVRSALPRDARAGSENFVQGLLTGDRALALPAGPGPREAARARAAIAVLTEIYRQGHIPFCQLTAAAQVASAAYGREKGSPRVAIGAVAGDGSAIGKAYMRMMLSAWGIACLDLGVDTPPETFLLAVREHGLSMVLCSSFGDAGGEQALALDRLARSAGLRDSFRILIGGAAMTAEQLSRMGADMLDTDAAFAAEQVARWLEV